MKVEILERTDLHRGWVHLENIRLRYQRFDGRMTPEIQLETLSRTHSVAVLPYDPVTDTVILIRQFRIGAYLAGEPGWCLEIVAGNCVDNDFPANARREVLEEVGWTVTELRPILSYFTSPNLSNERLHLFLGIIDSTNRADSGGGLLHEHEDIQVLPMPFSQAMARAAAGEFNTSPSILAMQWLAQHRDALRR
ncbi:MAG: NUDIX domain-containing protein [Magnetococcales bacterium]|nr:NUDIX domain-containing protein [Magnetococcales bacterium]